MKCLLLVISSIFLATPSALLADRCEDLYDPEQITFGILEEIETKITWVAANAWKNNREALGTEANQLHQELSKVIERFLELDPQDLREDQIFRSLKDRLEKLSESLHAKKTKAKSTSTSTSNLPEAVGSIVANKVYFTRSASQGDILEYIISDDVVSSVFYSDNKRGKDLANRFLNALKYGHSTGKSGVKKLTGRNNIFELKIIGKSLPDRLYGYRHNGILYFVLHSKTENHGSEQFYGRIEKQVNTIRVRNGH